MKFFSPFFFFLTETHNLFLSTPLRAITGSIGYVHPPPPPPPPPPEIVSASCLPLPHPTAASTPSPYCSNLYSPPLLPACRVSPLPGATANCNNPSHAVTRGRDAREALRGERV
ncbi:hypothetical protein E2C01_099983 [Portunus trituberculatus]|uniref:Uncharacterized protein n=1 Tax=Portunus trituberculatus TaxID=210409 RepID=A0A5B7KC50_PORTR|nr:hypothetical protein [Portunus trituberculatus]